MGRITRLFGDREFFAVLLKIALPITIQQLALSLLNVIDVLMIGQLGETRSGWRSGWRTSSSSC